MSPARWPGPTCSSSRAPAACWCRSPTSSTWPTSRAALGLPAHRRRARRLGTINHTLLTLEAAAAPRSRASPASSCAPPSPGTSPRGRRAQRPRDSAATAHRSSACLPHQPDLAPVRARRRRRGAPRSRPPLPATDAEPDALVRERRYLPMQKRANSASSTSSPDLLARARRPARAAASRTSSATHLLRLARRRAHRAARVERRRPPAPADRAAARS